MIILTNMCLVKDGDKILVQNRTKKDWPGLTLPGGKVKNNETVEESVIREVREETGLEIADVRSVGHIEWLIDGDRHLCILFETERFKGELSSNYEGDNFFIKTDELRNWQFSTDFDKILDMYGIIY